MSSPYFPFPTVPPIDPLMESVLRRDPGTGTSLSEMLGSRGQGTPSLLALARARPPSRAATGIVERGNIDLTTRPIVQNPDGTTSTVFSFSFNEDGREILVPRVHEGGWIMTEAEAIDEYHRTGRHLGIFSDPQSATAYARRLHEDYEQGRIRIRP